MVRSICKHCNCRVRKRLQHEKACVANPNNTRLFVQHVVECIYNQQSKLLNKKNLNTWLSNHDMVSINNVSKQNRTTWKQWLRNICELECYRIIKNEDTNCYHICEVLYYYFYTGCGVNDTHSANINIVVRRLYDQAYHDLSLSFLKIKSHFNIKLSNHIDAVIFLYEDGVELQFDELLYDTIEEYYKAAKYYKVYEVDDDGVVHIIPATIKLSERNSFNNKLTFLDKDRNISI